MLRKTFSVAFKTLYLIKIVFTIGFLFFTGNVLSQTVYVDSSIAVSGDGSSWANAYKELRTATKAAQTNLTITEVDIAKGTYLPTDNFNLDSTFCIFRGNLKLMGGYPNGGGVRDYISNPVYLDGLLATTAVAIRVIVIAGLPATADSVILDGINVRNGDARSLSVKTFNGQSISSNTGSGLCMQGNLNGNKIVIRNCTFSNNRATAGAGVYNRSNTGSPLFSNCHFINNIGHGGLSTGTNSYGAGLYNSQSSPIITDCIFSGNSFDRSGYGIGIYNEASSIFVTNCSFINNHGSSEGAGIANYVGASAAITNCTFDANNCSGIFGGQGDGGAIANVTSSMNIDKCLFSRNVGITGGGIYTDHSSLTLKNSTFYGNVTNNSGTFPGGGGISVIAGSPIISNCSFIKDTTTKYGGAIGTFNGAQPLVSNCTFYGNFCQFLSSQGGAVYSADSSGGKYKNCLFWKDTVANTFPPTYSEFYSLNNGSRPAYPQPSISYSIIKTPFPIQNVIDSGNNSNNYPLFVDTTVAGIPGVDGIYGTADDGLRLQSCSPGIDAGLNSAIPAGVTTDIKGDTRISNNSVDIGAYENVSPVIAGATTNALNGDSTFKSVYGLIDIMSNCRLIASITPSGTNPLANGIFAKVSVDDAATAFPRPYVLRYYDINPSQNAATATATIKLYFTQADFDAYNLIRGTYPSMPIDATDAANYKANIIVHQFHGVNDLGNEVIVIPTAVTWNNTNTWWEVSFNVTGFSRFYLSTVTTPIPVVLEYFTGQKINNSVLVNWKADCSNSALSTFTLEKSNDATRFADIYTTTSTEQRCLQPFSFTDNNLFSGRNFYRLKMTDMNGKLIYSNILFFNNGKPEEIYITPTLLHRNEMLHIAVQQNGYNLSVYNVNGSMLIKQQLSSGINNINMPVTTAGTYFYRITDTHNMKIKTGKLIVQ
ncbi:MAG: right-handed parallel beta-helix repeat-containing protein [Ferruginibacter sp.]